MDRATQARLTARIRALARGRSTDLAAATYRVPGRPTTRRRRRSPPSSSELFLARPAARRARAATRARPATGSASRRAAARPSSGASADGTLRAFVNACRHRGMRVASRLRARRRACSSARITRGATTATGRLDGDPGRGGLHRRRPRRASRCTPLPVREAGGPRLRRPRRPASRRRRADLGGADAELAPFDLGAYHPIERREHRFAINWKLVDRLLHGGVPPRTSSTRTRCGRSSTATSRRSTPSAGTAGSSACGGTFDDAGDDDGDLLPHVTLLYQLFPNAVLIHQQDHVELYQAFPDLARSERVRGAR